MIPDKKNTSAQYNKILVLMWVDSTQSKNTRNVPKSLYQTLKILFSNYSFQQEFLDALIKFLNLAAYRKTERIVCAFCH